jgi:hypothetical protein
MHTSISRAFLYTPCHALHRVFYIIVNTVMVIYSCRVSLRSRNLPARVCKGMLEKCRVHLPVYVQVSITSTF